MKFDDWIKELASSLIASGELKDEIFSKCAPVCKLDVSRHHLSYYNFLSVNDLNACPVFHYYKIAEIEKRVNLSLLSSHILDTGNSF